MIVYTGLTKFPIALLEMGSEGADFRSENTSDNDQQRYLNILQNDASGMTCEARLVRVHHGRYKRGSHDAATVLFIDFIFSETKKQLGERRFRRADIEVQFERRKGETADREDPIIERIAPEGFFTADPVIKNVATRTSVGMHLAIKHDVGDPGTPVGSSAGVNIGLGFKRTVWSQKEARASIEGQRLSSADRNSGEPNVARWTLMENKFMKDGIPDKLETVLLLRPETAGAFEARVRIKTKVDWIHPIKSLFGQRMVNPVLFAAEGKREELGQGLPAGLDVTDMSAFDIKLFAMAVSVITLR